VHDEENRCIVLIIPKQLVVFLEQNRNINDVLEMKLIFPDGQEVKYTIPVMKYWEFDDKKLLEKRCIRFFRYKYLS
jgi:hypothetical protein